MPDWYPDLLDSVSSHITSGHRRAVRAANTELLRTYWSIGREILDRQQREGWGAKVIDRLSAHIRSRFPDARGYSPRNLRYMRAFAAAWPAQEIVQGTLAQLPWYHHLALLDKVRDQRTREWYAAAAVANGWSRDVLALQIDSRLHQRSGKAVTNFAATMPPEDSDLAQQATRDPYLFDFLSTTETRLERDLGQALLDHVSSFLLELGQGFALVGRQYRLANGTREFHCDLLLYHIRLRRYVVVELKAVDFDPGFLSQLGMYLAAVDDLVAGDGDQPTGPAAVPIEGQRGRRVRAALDVRTDRRVRVGEGNHHLPARRLDVVAAEHRGPGERAGDLAFRPPTSVDPVGT